MSHCEEGDIWEQFETAVKDAESELSEAHDHYAAIRDFGGDLDAAYAEALDELAETVDEFDSVFDVSDEKLDAAVGAARQGTFLVDLLLAHRRYYEGRAEDCAQLISRRFETLEAVQHESSTNPDSDIEAIKKQLSVISKLLEGGKHRKLRTSDRISLDDVEEQVAVFDEELREATSPGYYAHHVARLIDTLRDRYTDDLSWLNEQGADHSAISVTERIQRIPDIDDIDVDDPKASSVTREEAARVGEAAAAHYEVAVDISDRRRQFELGAALGEAVREHAKIEDEAKTDFRQLTRTFDLDAILSRIARILRSEATTSTSEQVLRLLRQHNGSVGETADTLDLSTGELFEVLQQLYEEQTVTDLKVQFE